VLEDSLRSVALNLLREPLILIVFPIPVPTVLSNCTSRKFTRRFTKKLKLEENIFYILGRNSAAGYKKYKKNTQGKKTTRERQRDSNVATTIEGPFGPRMRI
jgi:hypothetical protein